MKTKSIFLHKIVIGAEVEDKNKVEKLIDYYLKK